MFKHLLGFAVSACLIVGGDTQGFAQNATQAPGSVASPILSFLLDPTGGLHALNGIAGSASVGPSLGLGVNIRQAVVSPGHDYILANTDNGLMLLRAQGTALAPQTIDVLFGSPNNNLAACYAIAGLPSFGPKFSTCTGAPSTTPTPSIDSIVLSPTGSAAALYSASEGRIYSLGQVSQSPVLVASFETRALGGVSAFAISDDGQSAVVGTTAGDSGSIYIVSANAAPQPVGNVHHASAIRFFSNGGDAVVADDVDNAIYRISAGQLFMLATASDGISIPRAIAVSNDNQKVFVGNAQSGSVTTLSLAGGPAESTLCHCTITGLYPTNTDSVFRLTDYSGGPVVLFDDSGIAPRIVFAPSAPRF